MVLTDTKDERAIALTMPNSCFDQESYLIKCPICGSDGKCLYTLKPDYIRAQLQHYYNELVPQNISVIDYDVLRCRKCYLEYAMPMLPGSDLFYAWITSHPSYYPTVRWEWQVALDIIKMKNVAETHLLEIGCGVGDFLEQAKKINNLKSVGIDLTKGSVDRCCGKGLNAYCETIEEYGNNPDHNIKKFDFVVAFHTLEHVTDPKGFVASLSLFLKPGGCILLSTPYSPMSFESSWFDPLNHPPHHLTRWNLSSYQELAAQLGMHIDLFMPEAGSIIYRTFISLNLLLNGVTKPSKKRVLLKCIIHPLKVARELLRQSKREKINNRVSADVVLVKLREE